MAGNSPITIVNVDDNEAARHGFSLALRQAGFVVTEAATGREALRVVAATQPHLVLLEVGLPDISGFEVCRRLKADPRTASILVLQHSAAFTKSTDRVQGLEGGADGYLRGAVEPQEVVATVKALLRTRHVEEFQRTIEELQVAEEELRQQNEELLRTRAAVEAERQRYQELFEAAPDGYVVTDAYGNIQEVNRAAAALLHQRREDMVQRPLRVFLDQGDRQPFLTLLNQLRRGEEIGELEVHFHPPNGMRFAAALTVAALRDPHGMVSGLRWLLRDITERKRAEEALRESEERYRSLFENANDAIVTFTLDGIVTSVNRGLEVMLGWSREELIGQHYRKFVTPASATLGEERTRRFLAGEHLPSIFEGEHVGKDGRVVPVEVRTRAIRNREGQPIGFQGIYRDITERKRLEEALRKSAEHFRALVEHALDFVVVLNRDGTVRYESPAVARMLGYTPEERVGRNGFEHIHPDDMPQVRQTFARTIQLPGETASLEFRARHKDGSWRTLEAVGTNLLADPAVAGVVVNYRDTTERKRMEEALRNAHAELENRVQERTAALSHANAALQQEITARQHTEAALSASEKRFRALIENSADAIALIAADGTLLYVSPSGSRMFDRSWGERLGLNVFDLIHPEDLPLITDRFARLLQAPELTVSAQFRYLRKDNSWQWVEAVGRNLLAEPAVQAIVLNYRDITDRKLAEAARTQLAAIVESSDDAIIGKTLDGVIVSWNTGAERLYGYAAAEVIGRPISILAPPDRSDEIGEILKRIQRGERVEQFETVRRRKDGWQVPVSLTVSPIKDTIGKTVGASAIARDITERKRLQELLQQERNLLEVTLASIGDAVIATDLTGALTFINPVAETLTGWTAQEAVGRDIREVFQIINEHSRQPAENPLEKVLREGVVVGLANHTVLIARDGKEVPIADSGAPIQGPSGQVQGMVMVFRDVTGSKQAEATLRQAKEAAEAADRAKSDFLATVSHELRTPLYIIVSYTDFLVEGEFGPLQPEQQRPMLAIKRNAAELYELIIGMLDLSQLQREGQLPVDIHAVPLPALFRALQEETQERSAQAGLEFVWTIEPNLAPIWTDLGKLKTVLKNLLGNAMKFTSKGQITVAASARHGGVEISVSDTGQGIPPDALSLIFEPFRQGDSSLTRSYGGVGLGLYIVKSFLTLLGGKITVESEVGRGSTFRVWLPLSTEPTSGV